LMCKSSETRYPWEVFEEKTSTLGGVVIVIEEGNDFADQSCRRLK